MENSGCLIVAVIAILASCIIFDYSVMYSNPHYETIIVKEKSINPKANDSYLVFTEREVYAIEDLLLIGFFESSDVYNKISVGDTIRVKVCGQRVPLVSAYKNIHEVIESDKL